MECASPHADIQRFASQRGSSHLTETARAPLFVARSFFPLREAMHAARASVGDDNRCASRLKRHGPCERAASARVCVSRKFKKEKIVVQQRRIVREKG
jgi:hypothetical protein